MTLTTAEQDALTLADDLKAKNWVGARWLEKHGPDSIITLAAALRRSLAESEGRLKVLNEKAEQTRLREIEFWNAEARADKAEARARNLEISLEAARAIRGHDVCETELRSWQEYAGRLKSALIDAQCGFGLRNEYQDDARDSVNTALDIPAPVVEDANP